MSSDSIKNVVLLGATGSLGTEILNALLSSPHQFNVTIAQRASSSLKSSAPKVTTSSRTYATVTIDDGLSLPSLQAAFRGQHAVVVAFRPTSGGDPAAQLRIAEAAARTPGMRRIIPADYGSCDSTTARAQELVPIFKRKAEVREKLQALAAAAAAEAGAGAGAFSWTSIVCGHFFDWGLRENFLHFNLRTHEADILGDGTMRSSTSTLSRVAEAVVRVLLPQHEAATRNRIVYVQSFCVSQNDVLAALERASSSGGDGEGEGAGKKWKTNYIDAEEFIAEHRAKRDAGDAEANEDLVFALGAIDGDWTTRGDAFAMEMLGLKDEDLDEVVGRVVRELR
ncbi:hypothetical protein Micbo1qcDRAFT_235722 [Microdochium bolleyi]|uniref:NmrA-like domain-containing protein n=1 Tax=Microdochium bolleyi TaxID=196109 RepID=A0A136IVI6_9PEZI|nr:hypothetical protein Micbo1qcDRAFT_235722 [Microdochium bolleyi]